MSLVTMLESTRGEAAVTVKKLGVLADVATCAQLAETWGGKLYSQSESTGDCTIDVTFVFANVGFAAKYKDLLDSVPIAKETWSAS